MTRRQHHLLRGLAIGVLVLLHYLPRGDKNTDKNLKLARNEQRAAEEHHGSAAGSGTASLVVASAR